MYCRECGNQMPHDAIKCTNCGTTAGEGFEFCNHCGQHTSERTKYCRHCGAKLDTIVPRKILVERVVNLQKRAKIAKNMLNALKFIRVGSVVVMVSLILVLVLRPQPDKIPPPRKPDEFLRVGNVYVYDGSYVSEERAEYSIQSRTLISCTAYTFSTFVVSLISGLHWKKSYKKILTDLEETKNVL